MMCKHKLALISAAKKRWPTEPLLPCGDEVSLANCFRIYKINSHYQMMLYYNLSTNHTFSETIKLQQVPQCCSGNLEIEDCDEPLKQGD